MTSRCLSLLLFFLLWCMCCFRNGNTHAQTGTIIKTDGSSGTIIDVWFDADTADTIDRTEVEIPDEIKLLPDVFGFGNVHNLHTAMALDESGELKALVEQYAA